VPKLSMNFEEILSRADGKPEKQNKVLESSVININYCIIIIINTQYSFFFSWRYNPHRGLYFTAL